MWSTEQLAWLCRKVTKQAPLVIRLCVIFTLLYRLNKQDTACYLESFTGSRPLLLPLDRPRPTPFTPNCFQSLAKILQDMRVVLNLLI